MISKQYHYHVKISLCFILLKIVIRHDQHVQARSSFILRSSQPKCVYIDQPHDSFIVIGYKAPDIIVLPKDDSSTNRDFEVSGRDNKNRKLVDEMRKKINEFEKTESLGAEINISDGLPGYRGPKTFTETFPMTSSEDYIPYTTKSDGIVEICVRIFSASFNRPSRVVLFIDDSHVPREVHEKAQEDVARGVRAMESEIHYVRRLLNQILSRADYAKDQDVQLHDKSIQMNSDAHTWPMIQIVVLIITGVLQITQLGNFLKHRVL